MDPFDLYRSLSVRTDSKILLFVMDGLGGHPHPEHGVSELEAARIPNLDALAQASACGLSVPLAWGITPGSGPSHLALFGYDPFRYVVGRGVLSALGVEFDLRPGDVAARANFCTVDPSGRITDRRAGRIPTEECARLCSILRERVRVPGVEIFIEPEMEYRAAFVLRGDGLSGALTDSDPQRTGVPPVPVRPRDPADAAARRTAELVNSFLEQARKALEKEHPANMILLRGFDTHSAFPTLEEVFKLRAACIATYPMYKGLSKLVGMKILKTGISLEEEYATLKEHWDAFDFFYFHVKKTDSMGEDGNFDGKVRILEEVDAFLPRILELRPDVLAVTGDHATPCILKAHSWHPVPFLLQSSYCQPDAVDRFTEKAFAQGSLNGMRHTDIMPLLMANALKFIKFGA
jgi:2,3-bisphosphoglycerate-independent phosphoglycerate mutase